MEPGRTPGNDQDLVDTAMSKNGLGEQSGTDAEGGPDWGPGETAAVLHSLNNALVSILLNAQVIEFRLPSYSRLKRNLHEIERSAQRAGMLVKRLLRRRGGNSPSSLLRPEVADDPVAAAPPDPAVEDHRLRLQFRPASDTRSRPQQNGKKVTHTMV